MCRSRQDCAGNLTEPIGTHYKKPLRRVNGAAEPLEIIWPRQTCSRPNGSTRGDVRRLELADVTERTFLKHGFSATTMQMIASEGEVPRKRSPATAPGSKRYLRN
jgi:hypothetical protein